MYKMTINSDGVQFDSILMSFASPFLLCSYGGLNVNGPHWLIYFMLGPKFLDLFEKD